MSWYFGVWSKYAVFAGRARRREYWFFYLFNMLAAFLFAFVDGALRLGTESGGPLYGLYVIAALIPTVAVGVRRMHDSNHRGWWLIVPLANLVLLLSPGTPGDNRFGPDPKQVGFAYVAPATPAGWYPDPTGRHEYRYWDGRSWGPHVSDSGVQSYDAWSASA